MPSVAWSQTLDDCQQAAARNYPLVQRYGLIEKTTSLTLSNLKKEWLPKISASAQGTLQSDVVAWPDEMRNMLNQMGLNLAGLKKEQYRVGLDVNQTLYDGNSVRLQQQLARQQALVESAQTDVGIYALRQRVNEMYFGLLLLDEKIELNHQLQELLRVNEQTLESMFRHGTAAETDYNAIKAERLAAAQEGTALTTQRETMREMLELFCGIAVQNPVEPAPIAPIMENKRPELKAFDSELQLLDAQEKLLHANLLPRVGLFASGYYGYPGYNMFKDMVRHRMSLNATIGLRITWNIGSLYTRKNDLAKIATQRAMTENRRDIFLFDNRLKQTQEQRRVAQYRRLMADDDDIIRLRSAIRKSAESKLAHGIIDTHDLVRDIFNENAAYLQRSMHKIEMLKELYDLQYTLNQ